MDGIDTRQPHCKVVVDGRDLAIAERGGLVRVAVDLDADLFALCELLFHDPELELIDGPRFASGVPVEVKLGFGRRVDKVFTGEVVALEPRFVRDLPPSLRVVCHDPLHRLALSQMTRALNDVDDKQIATQVARAHGLTAEAPSGSREHFLQAAISDALLLRRIAAKNGHALRIEGKKVVIGPPPQGVEVTVEPGSMLTKMKVKISSKQQVGEVEVRGWDPKAKREIVSRAKPEGEAGDGARKYGKSAVLAVAGHGIAPADTAAAEAMAKGRLRKLAEGFIVASGEMVGDPRVVPGAVLAVQKIDANIDGKYRVDHAEHRFSRLGYQVKFRAVRVGRNARPKAIAPRQQSNGALSLEDAIDRANHGLTNPRWGQSDHEHSDYGEMIVDCKNIDGRTVEFIVYHEERDGSWTEIVRKHTVAQGTEVRAKVKLLHEDHPDTPAATKSGKRPVGGILANARWGKTDHAHGEEGEMIVDVRPGYEGARVIFAVERNGSNGWEPAGTVQALVSGGQAQGKLPLMHPAAGQESAPAELRFTVHVEVESKPRAVRFDAHIL